MWQKMNKISFCWNALYHKISEYRGYFVLLFNLKTFLDERRDIF